MRINFDFGDLSAFLMVAEMGSFQRAAQELNISQSAVTRRIQKLEENLGTVLFERTTRSLKMTLAARQFRERARAIIADVEEAVDTVGSNISRSEYYRNTVITIATIQTFTHRRLPQLISAFRAAGYTSRIRILDLFANDVVDAVSQGEADFGISFMGMQEHGLEFTSLIEDPFVAVIHREHPLARKERLSWSDLADQPLAIPWKGSGNRMLIDDVLSRAKLTLDWTYQVRHSATLLALAESGVSLALLPRSAAPTADDSILVVRPLVDPAVSRMIGTVRRTGQSLTASAEAFYQLIHQ